MTTADTRKQLGAIAEQIAADHLTRQGYKIIKRNWRCRYGEIDLIAEIEGIIVIVEVRSRRLTGRFGTAHEAVTPKKQQQVRLMAQMYLMGLKGLEKPVRFDAACVHFHSNGEFDRIDHIQNAF